MAILVAVMIEITCTYQTVTFYFSYIRLLEALVMISNLLNQRSIFSLQHYL